MAIHRVNLCLTAHLKASTAADHMKDLGRLRGMGRVTTHQAFEEIPEKVSAGQKQRLRPLQAWPQVHKVASSNFADISAKQ